MADYSHQVRRAVIATLKANAGVTSLIPAGSLYPATVPVGRTFPFGRYGAATAAPFRTSGLNSSSHRFAYHAFTKPLYETPGDPRTAMVADAAARAEDIAAAIKTALDGRVLTIDGGMRATLSWLGSNCLADPTEADAWHAIVNFLAEVAG